MTRKRWTVKKSVTGRMVKGKFVRGNPKKPKRSKH